MPFLVATKRSCSSSSYCFMCLKQISNSDKSSSINVSGLESHHNNNTSILPLKWLARHLKLELGKVFGTTTTTTTTTLGASSSPLGPVGNDELAAGGVVPFLCEGCGSLAGKFSEGYRRLELVRLEVDSAVREMHGVMVRAEQDEELVFQYRQSLLAEEKEEESASLRNNDIVPPASSSSSLSDKLRKEVLEKCSTLVNVTPGEDEALSQFDDVAPNSVDATGDDCQGNTEQEEGDSSAISGGVGGRSNFDCKNQVSPSSKLADGHGPKNPSERVQTRSQTGTTPKLAGRNGKPAHLECELCVNSKPFKHLGLLLYHKHTAHRTSLFLEYRDPKFTPDQFEGIVDRLFKGLLAEPKRRQRNSYYKCSFCESFRNKLKVIVHSHCIRTHMEQLVVRLMELQKKTSPEEASTAAAAAAQTDKGESKKKGGKVKKSFQRYHFWYNMCSTHRSSLFAKYKDPSLPPDRFEQCLEKIFKHVDLQKGWYHMNKCAICESGGVGVEDHVIQAHVEGLVPEVMNQQLSQLQLLQKWRARSGGSGVVSKKNRSSFTTKPIINPIPSVPPPSTSHLGGGKKRFNCNLCTKAFSHPSGVVAHKYADHLSVYFEKYQHASLSPVAFEQILVKLLASLDVSRMEDGGYKCGFEHCTGVIYQRSRVQNHFIVHHREELAPRLMELQREMLEASVNRPPPPIPTLSSRPMSSMPPPPPPKRSEQIRKCEAEATFPSRSSLSTSTSSLIPKPPPPAILPPTGNSAAKCQHCNKHFGNNPAILREHIESQHRSSLFLQFKDPRLTPSQFGRVVDRLFEEIEVPQQPGGGGYKCLFCHPVVQFCSTLPKTYSHFISRHLDELRSRLPALQAKLFPPHSFVGPRSSIRHVEDTGEVRISHVASLSSSSPGPGPASALEMESHSQFEEEQVEVSFSCTYCGALFPSSGSVQCHAYMRHGSQLLSEWKHPLISSDDKFDRIVYKLLSEELRIRQGRKGAYKCPLSFCEFQGPTRPEAICHLLSTHRDQVLEMLNKLQNNAIRIIPHQHPGSSSSSTCGLLQKNQSEEEATKEEPMEFDESQPDRDPNWVVVDEAIRSISSQGHHDDGSGDFVKPEKSSSTAEEGIINNDDADDDAMMGVDDDPLGGDDNVNMILGI